MSQTDKLISLTGLSKAIDNFKNWVLSITRPTTFKYKNDKNKSVTVSIDGRSSKTIDMSSGVYYATSSNTAKRVSNALTIRNGESVVNYDGSSACEIIIPESSSITSSNDNIILGGAVSLSSITEVELDVNTKHVFLKGFNASNDTVGYVVTLPTLLNIKPGHTIRFYDYQYLSSSNKHNYYISTGYLNSSDIKLFALDLSYSTGSGTDIKNVSITKTVTTYNNDKLLEDTSSEFLTQYFYCFNIASSGPSQLTNTIFDMVWDGNVWLCKTTQFY